MNPFSLLPIWLASLAALAPTVVFGGEAGRAPTVVVNQGDRTLTYVEVAPPAIFAAKPAASARAALAPSAVLTRESAPAKRYVELVYTATVYLDTPVLTELRWQHEGVDYVAFSNVDFRHLSGLFSLETDTTEFGFMPFVTSDMRQDVSNEEQARLRSLPRPPMNGANFVVLQPAEPKRDPSALLGLAALHAYFTAHRGELEAATLRREAEERQAEFARATEVPGPRKSRTVRYWINQKGGRP
jgi:hypothetical protein